jgi:two-component sensor histidine kinase
MALEICEENFNTLLSLRLEKDADMIATMRQDALEQIEVLSDRFIDIDLLIAEQGRLVSVHSADSSLPSDGIDDLPKHTSEVQEWRTAEQTLYLYTAYFPFWRWNIVSVLPKREAFAGVTLAKRFITIALLIILLALVLTLLTVFFFLVKRPLSRITEATKRISDGTFVTVDTHRSDEMGQVITAFNTMVKTLEYNQTALEKSLKEKEVLLKEIHHRVKNNLTIVASLLNLQRETVFSTEGALRALRISQNRVYSMALVHEHLYQSDSLAAIDMNSYINLLVTELQANYGLEHNVDVTMKADNIFLSIEHAVPCGLLLNELITNAMVHAFPDSWWSDEKRAEIRVLFEKRQDDHVTLAVQDNGIGLSGDGRESYLNPDMVDRSIPSEGIAEPRPPAQQGRSSGGVTEQVDPSQESAEKDNPSPASAEQAHHGEQNSLGLQLIRILSKQLKGDLQVVSNHGTDWRVTFPIASTAIDEGRSS